MLWLLPTLIANCVTTVVLVLIYGFLWWQERQRFLWWWTAAWAVYLGRFLFMLPLAMGWESSWLLLGNQLCVLVSAWLLLQGSASLIGRRLPWPWWWLTGLVALWIPIGLVWPVKFQAQTLPIMWFSAVVFIAAAIMLWRSDLPRFSTRLVAVALCLWGLHTFDYPFLRSVTWFAPWGYLLSAGLAMVVAVGMILVFIDVLKQRTRHRQQAWLDESMINDQILAQVPAGIVLLGPDACILRCNLYAMAWLGEDLAGRNLRRQPLLVQDRHLGEVSLTAQPWLQALAVGVACTDRCLGIGSDAGATVQWLRVDCHPIETTVGERRVLITLIDPGQWLGMQAGSLSEHDPLRQLVERIPCGAVLRAGDELALNQAMGRLIGGTETGPMGVAAWFRRLFGARAAEMQQQYENWRSDGFCHALQLAFVRADGEQRRLELVAHHVEGREIWLVNDITERQLALAELQESEARYSGLFNNTHTPMLVIDPEDGRIVQANIAAEHLYRYSRIELCRLHIDDIAIGPTGAGQGHRACLQVGEQSCQHRLADGSLREVEVFSGAVSISGHGYLCSVIRDVSQRRSAENVVNQFFQQSTVVMGIAGFEGHFLRLNPTLPRLLGYPEAFLLQRPIIEFVHPDDQEKTLAVMSGLSRGESISGFGNRFQTADGSYLHLAWTASTDSKRELIYAVAIDVTDRYQLQEELRQSQKMDAVGQLAGGIAHDFNNQLQCILGYLELAERNPSPEMQANCLRVIREAASRSSELTRQLLTFSRRHQPESRPVDCHAVVDEVLQLLRRSVDRRIRIETSLAATEMVVAGDYGRIQNALLNLTINARDAMPDGGVLRLTSTTATVPAGVESRFAKELAPGRYCCLGIEDTGPGMSPDILDRIFEPFFTTKEEGLGTGLGLSAVYATVEQIQGDLRVRSRLGSGTRFELLLPVCADQSDLPTSSFQHRAIGNRIARVLVVDDEELIRLLVSEALEDRGHTVISCGDGAEALAWLQAHDEDLDLVLLDINMPERSGVQVLSWLHVQRPELPVVMMSGQGRDQDVDRLHDLGASGFLMKPFTLQDLHAEIQGLLAR